MIDSKENDKFDQGAKGLTNGKTIIIHVSSVIHRFCSSQPLKKKKEKHWPAKALYFFVLFE